MNKLINMLKVHEGVETHAYKCTADKTTIGVGRNIDPAGGIGLSETEIDFLLGNDIERVEAELYATLPWLDGDDSVIGAVRLDALVDICFNLGLPRFLKFVKALDAAEAEDWDKAADEFLDSRWAKQVGSRAIEITEMIRTGEYQNDY
jgi:lysozyme|tara:strand:+ start:323 stop:766 length:444 start_codon:yes stop_codon:yes gene_type:complete